MPGIQGYQPLKHTCTIQSGDMAGSDQVQYITSYDIRFNSECDNCGKPLADTKEVLAHLYNILTGE